VDRPASGRRSTCASPPLVKTKNKTRADAEKARRLTAGRSTGGSPVRTWDQTSGLSRRRSRVRGPSAHQSKAHTRRDFAAFRVSAGCLRKLQTRKVTRKVSQTRARKSARHEPQKRTMFAFRRECSTEKMRYAAEANQPAHRMRVTRHGSTRGLSVNPVAHPQRLAS
jgi:hypothetical protein